MESLASVAHTEKNLVERPRLGGAFASYVRHRGEPDGKTMEPPNVLIPTSRQPCQNGGGKYLKVTDWSNRMLILCLFQISKALRRNLTLCSNVPGESDVAFTPSPPVALNLNHQTRIRNLYPDQNLVRPGSSSSSSVTDWDNGHATVLRRQPLPPLPANVLERLSVRTEIGTNSSRKPRHSATTNEDICSAQTDATQSTETHPQNLRNLTRELTPTISEVYHERNLGLGLAPSLSKLLEEVGVVSENEESQSAKTVGHGQTQNWMQNERISEPELCRRDEADGRSIAESQCSAASSNKIPRKAPAPPI